eukprot:COSAG06_NODE_5668_length_3331_cov_2.904084_2_plen_166_part_00
MCVERRSSSSSSANLLAGLRTSAEAGVGANRPHCTDAPHCQHSNTAALGRRVLSEAAAAASSSIQQQQQQPAAAAAAAAGDIFCCARVKLVSSKQRRMTAGATGFARRSLQRPMLAESPLAMLSGVARPRCWSTAACLWRRFRCPVFFVNGVWKSHHEVPGSTNH